MAKRVTKESIERLKSSFRLEDFVRSFVELKRAGDHYAGKCPFHADDSPSFAVYPDHYYCYGCKAQGDAFSFLENRDGLRFPEAVEAVASRMGFALDYENEREMTPEQERRERERKDALHLLTETAEFYHRVLLAPVGQRAREYLEERGYTHEHIKLYRLGLSLERDALVEEGKRRGWNVPILERLSLIQPSKHGTGHYDFFRDRIMIPIHDERANVVAFGGRIYLPQPERSDFKAPKYLNSKESDLFSKGATVFNLHRARGEIARSSQALLVEGFFDCLTLSAHGIENVVAALSTSITPQHLDKLHTLARVRELVVSFDADRSGQEATLKFFSKVFPLGKFVLRSLSVPDGKDPDEFIRSKGKAAFVTLLEGARPLMDQVCDIACVGIATTDVERRLQAVREKVLPAVCEHPDPAMRDLALQSVASFLKLSDHRFLLPSAPSAGLPVPTASSPRGPVPGSPLAPKEQPQARPAIVSKGALPPLHRANAGARREAVPTREGAAREPQGKPAQGVIRRAGAVSGPEATVRPVRSPAPARTNDEANRPSDGGPRPGGPAIRPVADAAGGAPKPAKSAGPSWKACPAEIKFVCGLLHAQRADLPARLRSLFEGSDVVDHTEDLRMEMCGETLTAQLSDDSKELVRDILHVQHALGGRPALQLTGQGEGGEISKNLRLLVALAQADEGRLEELGAPGLLTSLAVAGPSKGGTVAPGRGKRAVGNAYANPLSATLRLALSDAEFSSRQGNLKSGLERLLSNLERDHLHARWREVSKRLMTMAADAEERLRGEDELRKIEAALVLMDEREGGKKLGDDAGRMR